MATITTRVIVTVVTDDGREFIWENTKNATGPDATQWGLDVLTQTLLTLQAEDAADAVATSGVNA